MFSNIQDLTMLQREQLYLDELDINEVFNVNPHKYIFRHRDCPYVFVTDGTNLYAQDQDEREIDPVEVYGVYNVYYIYNNFQEFIDTFKDIEVALNRELFLADYSGGLVAKASIRALELYAINLEASNERT